MRPQLLRLTSESDSVDEPRTLWPRLRILPVGLRRRSSGAHVRARPISRMAGRARMSARRGMRGGRPRTGRLQLQAEASSGHEDGGRRDAQDPLTPPTPWSATWMARGATSTGIPPRSARGDEGTRSALAQVKHVLPDAVVADFKQRFAWVGRSPGRRVISMCFCSSCRSIVPACHPRCVPASIRSNNASIMITRRRRKAADELGGDRFSAPCWLIGAPCSRMVLFPVNLVGSPICRSSAWLHGIWRHVQRRDP